MSKFSVMKLSTVSFGVVVLKTNLILKYSAFIPEVGGGGVTASPQYVRGTPVPCDHSAFYKKKKFK